MTEISLTTEQQQKLNNAEAFLNGAKQFRIDNVDSYIMASKMLKEIKLKKNEYDNMRKELKAPIIKAGKQIEDFFRQPINFLTQAEQEYKKSISRYLESEDTKKTEQTKEKQALENKLNAKAVDALKANDVNAYHAAMEEITQLNQEITTVPKVDGISVRDNWKARVIDFPMLLHAIVEGKAPVALITVDDKALNALASSVKDTVTYPGIEFYNDKIVSVRT